jgi:hypothetical protein
MLVALVFSWIVLAVEARTLFWLAMAGVPMGSRSAQAPSRRVAVIHPVAASPNVVSVRQWWERAPKWVKA